MPRPHFCCITTALQVTMQFGCKIESVKVVLMLHKHIHAMHINYSQPLRELMQLKKLKSDIEKRTAKYSSFVKCA